MAHAQNAEERLPLLGASPRKDCSTSPVSRWQWTAGYSLKESHATMEDGHVVDYDPDKLSTMRVFCSNTGTVLSDPVLFVEQIILTVIFFSSSFVVFYFFEMELSKKGHTVDEWLDKQEKKMRSFSMILTTLSAFLLSFYTSICVARWWTIRTAGVGAVKAAAMDLEMTVHQFVCQDNEVLCAIRRYARASLALIFTWRRDGLEDLHNELNHILTKQEIDQLLSEDCGMKNGKVTKNMHETIWAWQVAIISQLYKEGKILSEPLLALLLQKCFDGRAGIQCIATTLSVRVPMQYVHLLGLMVKLHNFILALLMGILFGAAVRDARTIICVQLFARTQLLPFAFNSLLLINADLSDPFNGGESDFPGKKLDTSIENDGKALIVSFEHLPKWICDRQAKQV